MVLIDAARGAFLDVLTEGRGIAIAETVRREVRYWRDDAGTSHDIDLSSMIASGRLTVLHATAPELRTVLGRISSAALGAGELESMALVVGRGHRFCTADRVAKRAMLALGVADKWVSLVTLAGEAEPSFEVGDEKYR